jgi:hypothetical protein
LLARTKFGWLLHLLLGRPGRICNHALITPNPTAEPSATNASASTKPIIPSPEAPDPTGNVPHSNMRLAAISRIYQRDRPSDGHSFA